MRWPVRVHGIVVLLGALPASAQVATFRGLGVIGPANGMIAPNSAASGVSADGSVVVGTASVFDSFRWITLPEGAMWTAATGWVEGEYGGLSGVSGDGSTTVGWGFVMLSSPAPYLARHGYAVNTNIIIGMFNAASADGRYAVGYSNADVVRWSDAATVVVSPLAGFSAGEATGISADGSVVVGDNLFAGGLHQAFLWTAAGGTRGLGYLQGATRLDSQARGVSADGRTVVGHATNAVGNAQAFVWTGASGMQPLPLLVGSTVSDALAVSGDGSVIVGVWQQNAAGTRRAYYWDRVRGRRDFQQFLSSMGATGLAGWSLTYATAVSPDGSYIVGDGMNPQGLSEAWVAHIPAFCYADCDGSVSEPVLTVNDFTCFLNRFMAGDPYANCDGSTVPPGLNVADFVCFMNKFASGCP